MSRIYDALRKSENQETTITPVDAAQRPESPMALAVEREFAGQKTNEFRSQVGLGDASASYLRLEELRRRCAKPGWKINPGYSVFLNREVSNQCAEQFRTLRSRLYRLREKKSIRTLLITSASSGDGKSFVALNLAQAIVRQQGARALLIDADLRASRLHLRLGAPSAPGLADYLAGEADEFSVLQADTKEDLFFIPAGKSVPNAGELLAHERLPQLLARMAPVFEWIVVDAPPVLPVSDASVLASKCDGVILVMRAGVTPLELVQAAYQEFKENNVLGAVLNGADQQNGVYSYYGENGLDEH